MNSRFVHCAAGGVGVLLLIACAHLANLLLARGGGAQLRKWRCVCRWGRQPGRLIRQLVTESLALAQWEAWPASSCVLSSQRIGEDDDRIRSGVHMSFALDPLVLAFAGVSDTGRRHCIRRTSAWPGHQDRRGASLKEQSRSGTGSLGRMRWAPVLVSLQSGALLAAVWLAPVCWRGPSSISSVRTSALRLAACSLCGIRLRRDGAMTLRARKAYSGKSLGELQAYPRCAGGEFF